MPKNITARFVVSMLLMMPITLLQSNLGAAAISRPSSATEQSSVACPSRNFDKFLQAFADDVAIQRAYTQVPLKSTEFMHANPEPVPRTQWLRLADIRFPIMPSKADQEAYRAKTTIRKPSKNGRSVKVSGTDNGALVVYEFGFRAGCWMLISVDDQSM
ncbi:hypothetical protein EO087_11990 [Dyella sp. M7H15-1]|uniref:hypothetical protein n=1 Tax=Dyella sp. M7H15-1 TaxID=2501295 RepID=UPI0010052639|nr:hypothetical protein [Dyella sp. M7H15-1]QAU24623.1 hypothetical protein EO087_11990 [Dyella sp. M7H15-1]